MFMNIASDGSFRQYTVAIIPGQSMDSSAVPSDNLTATIKVIGENMPNIDWENILPTIEIVESQLA